MYTTIRLYILNSLSGIAGAIDLCLDAGFIMFTLPVSAVDFEWAGKQASPPRFVN